MGRFCDLPENTVIEIMSWLPFESLFRFKCVQKSWCALISTFVNDPWFVAKHVNNFENSSTLPFLFFRIWPGRNCNGKINTANSLLRIIVDNCNSNDDHINSKQTDFETPNVTRSLGGSHCHGIVCLPDIDKNTILLCNPVLGEFKLLGNTSFRPDFKTHMVGFGYDSIANVYKIVRIVRLSDGNGPFGAEVHTLGTNCWREIEIMPRGTTIHLCRNICNELYYKGVYYWLLTIESCGERSVLSFDIHKEVFQAIPLPEGHEEGTHQLYAAGYTDVAMCWKITLWNGRVTLLKYMAMGKPWDKTVPRPFEMWVMDNHHCWTKHPPIFVAGQVLYFPVLFWNSDELLVRPIQASVFCLYNLRTKKVRRVPIGNPANIYFKASVFPYVKSLVSISAIYNGRN